MIVECVNIIISDVDNCGCCIQLIVNARGYLDANRVLIKPLKIELPETVTYNKLIITFIHFVADMFQFSYVHSISY